MKELKANFAKYVLKQTQDNIEESWTLLLHKIDEYLIYRKQKALFANEIYKWELISKWYKCNFTDCKQIKEFIKNNNLLSSRQNGSLWDNIIKNNENELFQDGFSLFNSIENIEAINGYKLFQWKNKKNQPQKITNRDIALLLFIQNPLEYMPYPSTIFNQSSKGLFGQILKMPQWMDLGKNVLLPLLAEKMNVTILDDGNKLKNLNIKENFTAIQQGKYLCMLDVQDFIYITWEKNMQKSPKEKLKELFTRADLYNEEWFKGQKDFYKILYLNNAQEVNPSLYKNLLMTKDNGIALIGNQSPNIKNIYDKLIDNEDFINDLNVFFRETTLANFNKFFETWQNITKENELRARMPKVRINRVAASFSLNVTSACDESAFNAILKWFIENQIIEKISKGNWFEKNEVFTKIIDQILEIETNDQKIKRNVFVWKLYENYVKPKKTIYDEISLENGENKMSINEEVKKLLESNKQVILTGAPGTGKTFMAKEIAKELASCSLDDAENIKKVQFHPSFDYSDFVIGLKPEELNGQILFNWKDGVFLDFCKKAKQNLEDSQKSPEELKKEYNLQEEVDDFINALIDDNKELQTKRSSKFRVIDLNKNGNISIEIPENSKTANINLPYNEIIQLLQNDIKLDKVKAIRDYFKRKNAQQSDSYIFSFISEFLKQRNSTSKSTKNTKVDAVKLKQFVFIIDEINRADLSRVFGELFSCIEAEYRNEYILLPNGEKFTIPENVYIIGTMNDIDRSVESMDFALRRRFGWHEITAKKSFENIFSPEHEKYDEIKTRMENLNNAIIADGQFGTEYQIGAAYFLKYDKYHDFKQLWNNHIKVILNEYLRGRPNAKKTFEKWERAYNEGYSDEPQG